MESSTLLPFSFRSPSVLLLLPSHFNNLSMKTSWKRSAPTSVGGSAPLGSALLDLARLDSAQPWSSNRGFRKGFLPLRFRFRRGSRPPQVYFFPGLAGPDGLEVMRFMQAGCVSEGVPHPSHSKPLPKQFPPISKDKFPRFQFASVFLPFSFRFPSVMRVKL